MLEWRRIRQKWRRPEKKIQALIDSLFVLLMFQQYLRMHNTDHCLLFIVKFTHTCNFIFLVFFFSFLLKKSKYNTVNQVFTCAAVFYLSIIIISLLLKKKDAYQERGVFFIEFMFRKKNYIHILSSSSLLSHSVTTHEEPEKRRREEVFRCEIFPRKKKCVLWSIQRKTRRDSYCLCVKFDNLFLARGSFSYILDVCVCVCVHRALRMNRTGRKQKLSVLLIFVSL